MLAQTSLFDAAAEPSFDPLFRLSRRIDLGDGAWIDLVPRWLIGHDALFRTLLHGLAWKARQRPMYDRVVDVPRLLARLPDDGPVPPVLAQVSAALCRRYGRPMSALSAAYYRDGNDSVAPHGDRVVHPDDTLVGILALGHPRRLQLRPAAGGPGPTYALGWGDLLVMGGTCQRTWRHGIPKCASAGPRISVQLREPQG